MSIAASSRGSDIGSLPNVLFPSTGSFRYASAASESDALPASGRGEAGIPNLIIWGTDVNVETCKKQFIEFFKSTDFTVQQADMDEARLEWATPGEPKPLYLNKLEEILHVPNEPYMTLNCAHLKQWNEQIYWQLVKYPTEMVQTLDMAANELFQELYPESAENIVISVRPFNIDQTYDITDINPSDIGRLITIRGMVTRTSTLIPEMIRGFFKCSSCLFTKEANVSMGRIEEPLVCPACNNKFCFVLIHNRCRYIDRQVVKLQEAPDNMPAGRTPATIPLIACADLVDKVSPGDRVHVTGIYRGSQPRVIHHKRVSRSPCKVSIEVIHYRKMQSGKLYDESMELRLTPERIDKLKSLSQDKDIYQKLANSLCPSIFGHLDVKKGVLLQLFGGTKKELPGNNCDPKLRHFRSEINVLLCGDPSTSKSQLLQYVHKLVPRGQYTSGKGSSAVGLTAYVTRDYDTNQLVLQTGALVMCDGGICCIDEFDKMTDSTRSVLHEVMEQQTLSIAKAGIVCQLNARTSVLAAANPESSAWNPLKNIRENIKLPETLLSRFDLIYLILDPFKVEYDRQLAEHLISLYYGDLLVNMDILPHDTVRDYLAYARTEIQPRLTQASVDQLIENYIKLRDHTNTNPSKKNRITAYPRNLESLIRLSEAHARMRFSPNVESVDVIEAMRVTQEALMHSVTDPITGRINDELVMTV